MPASIICSSLCWSTPDGRELLSGLDLAFVAERTGLVGRNGIGKSTLLKLITGSLSPARGTITVTGRIAFLSQMVAPREGETIADLFGTRAALALLARAAAGKATAQELADADWTLEARMAEALARTGLHVAPETPLATLSGGEATRAALAALVFGAPDFLLLDEPTNSLDREGRRAVLDLLAGWRAGAIVVSHDRELLEAMDAIVELTSLGARRYGGNWSYYRAQKALELAAAEHDAADAGRKLAVIEQRAQQTRERQEKRSGTGRRGGTRGDQPRILLGKQKRRAEETTGALAEQADKRRQAAQGALEAARERLEVLAPLSITLPSTGLSSGREVLRAERIVAGYMPGRPVLNGLSLFITGPERIALTGPNGAGKSTLLAVIAGTLAPVSGTVSVLVPMAMLDQRVSILRPDLTIRDNFHRLNPGTNDNACRAALARFMFRADAALQLAGTLSGGQMLRAGLACVLGGSHPPQLLILDEPTNHLDMESIETIEEGLRAYDGAVIVVSHDDTFLDAIGITRHVTLTAS